MRLNRHHRRHPKHYSAATELAAPAPPELPPESKQVPVEELDLVVGLVALGLRSRCRCRVAEIGIEALGANRC